MAAIPDMDGIARTMRVCLAWQVISDGRPQVRRWSPDNPFKFLGYQKRTAEVIDYLHQHDDPRWPECVRAAYEPFIVIEDGDGSHS